MDALGHLEDAVSPFSFCSFGLLPGALSHTPLQRGGPLSQRTLFIYAPVGDDSQYFSTVTTKSQGESRGWGLDGKRGGGASQRSLMFLQGPPPGGDRPSAKRQQGALRGQAATFGACFLLSFRISLN